MKAATHGRCAYQQWIGDGPGAGVGMPKDVPWHGKTVHTGIWKEPVAGPRMVRRLDIDGEGQIRSSSPPPTRCLEARCRALVSEGQAAEGLYREAIDRLSRTRIRAALPDLDPIPVPA